MAEGKGRVRTWDVARPRGVAWRPDTRLIGDAREALERWFATDTAAGRLLPWLPVCFGIGIVIYFAAEHEPALWGGVPLAGVLAVITYIARARPVAFPLLIGVTAAAAGFAIATVKTARVAHPILQHSAWNVPLSGFIEVREQREKTDRIVVRVHSIEGRLRDAPDRVRLSVKKRMAPPVGTFVQVNTRLNPPLRPLRPGGYDFSRALSFQRIGATGFVTGAIRIAEPPVPPSAWVRYATTIAQMRGVIDTRIRAALSGDEAAIASALLTGARDAISTPVNDALFISGLGHVLSISGYHMAVVAGVVFFAIRGLLALVPLLTVGFPIKKWSAAVALAAALFYLLLSGSEVATQRSFFMTAVVLIAVLVDRRAVTFRTLAVAAMIVLAIAPEALVHPSFQMSFAATLGLVALVQVGMPALFASPENSATARVALWGGREIAMLALVSLVAGLATMPYAAFHFHRVTPYGVLANLAARPVVSVVVMPAGLLGLVAMPFGFDGLFWAIMGIGIDWMIYVTQWVAALPGAVGRIAAFGTGPLIASSVGIILLGLLRTPLRWSGAGAVALAGVWVLVISQPEVLISADGHVAVRGRDRRLHLMRTGKDGFLMKEWLAAD